MLNVVFPEVEETGESSAATVAVPEQRSLRRARCPNS